MFGGLRRFREIELLSQLICQEQTYRSIYEGGNWRLRRCEAEK